MKQNKPIHPRVTSFLQSIDKMDALMIDGEIISDSSIQKYKAKGETSNVLLCVACADDVVKITEQMVINSDVSATGALNIEIAPNHKCLIAPMQYKVVPVAQDKWLKHVDVFFRIEGKSLNERLQIYKEALPATKGSGSHQPVLFSAVMDAAESLGCKIYTPISYLNLGVMFEAEKGSAFGAELAKILTDLGVTTSNIPSNANESSATNIAYDRPMKNTRTYDSKMTPESTFCYIRYSSLDELVNIAADRVNAVEADLSPA